MKNRYVDIHAHILPNVDDGAKDMEESMSMLHMAYNEGIRTIIATPHYGMEQYTLNPVVCESIVEKLNKNIISDNALDGMKILLGNELLYHSDIFEDIKKGLAVTLADTNYVLVEFLIDAPFSTLEACAKEMKIAGYKPIYAHIERYFCLMEDISRLDILKSLGVMLQVNSIELEELPNLEEKRKFTLFRRNQFDPDEERKRIAWEFVLSGRVDLIASDAHNTDWRKPVMKTAFDNIRTVAGDVLADMLIKNANNILK